MGCGIAHFGRRGLETTQTDNIWSKILSPGVWTHGATEIPIIPKKSSITSFHLPWLSNTLADRRCDLARQMLCQPAIPALLPGNLPLYLLRSTTPGGATESSLPLSCPYCTCCSLPNSNYLWRLSGLVQFPNEAIPCIKILTLNWANWNEYRKALFSIWML